MMWWSPIIPYNPLEVEVNYLFIIHFTILVILTACIDWILFIFTPLSL